MEFDPRLELRQQREKLQQQLMDLLQQFSQMRGEQEILFLGLVTIHLVHCQEPFFVFNLGWWTGLKLQVSNMTWYDYIVDRCQFICFKPQHVTARCKGEQSTSGYQRSWDTKSPHGKESMWSTEVDWWVSLLQHIILIQEVNGCQRCIVLYNMFLRLF